MAGADVKVSKEPRFRINGTRIEGTLLELNAFMQRYYSEVLKPSLERAGASSHSDSPKSATPETETPCRCGVVPLPDEAYPFFNPHDLHSATPEKGSE